MNYNKENNKILCATPCKADKSSLTDMCTDTKIKLGSSATDEGGNGANSVNIDTPGENCEESAQIIKKVLFTVNRNVCCYIDDTVKRDPDEGVLVLDIEDDDYEMMHQEECALNKFQNKSFKSASDPSPNATNVKIEKAMDLKLEVENTTTDRINKDVKQCLQQSLFSDDVNKKFECNDVPLKPTKLETMKDGFALNNFSDNKENEGWLCTNLEHSKRTAESNAAGPSKKLILSENKENWWVNAFDDAVEFSDDNQARVQTSISWLIQNGDNATLALRTNNIDSNSDNTPTLTFPETFPFELEPSPQGKTESESSPSNSDNSCSSTDIGSSSDYLEAISWEEVLNAESQIEIEFKILVQDLRNTVLHTSGNPYVLLHTLEDILKLPLLQITLVRNVNDIKMILLLRQFSFSMFSIIVTSPRSYNNLMNMIRIKAEQLTMKICKILDLSHDIPIVSQIENLEKSFKKNAENVNIHVNMSKVTNHEYRLYYKYPLIENLKPPKARIKCVY